MTENFRQAFNIVRKVGSPTKVTLVKRNGEEFTVYKPDDKGIFVPEWGIFVKCAPYDVHFIFEVPKDLPGWTHMCSCGSPAVAVSGDDYGHLGSPEGMMFVCKSHLDTSLETGKGLHADGAS